MKKILILCIDGLGPEYLEASPTPNIDHMVKEGFFVIGRCMIPSVTNLNNVSIITGKPPRVHGITSNYWVDRATGEGRYMESSDFLRCPTILQRAKKAGMTTALLTAKKKLLRLLQAGADYSLSAEEPDEEMVRKVGSKEDIYSAEINLWLLEALRVMLREKKPDIVYCSTTDWAMHKYAPCEKESIRHVQAMDSILGRVLDENPDLEVYLTADHGMSEKTWGVDLRKVLASKGIASETIPIIKDRYVEHHQNLGGAAYVYLEKQELVREAMGILRDFPGVDGVYSREEAAERFELMEERIGDIFVLGDKDTVFGDFESPRVPVKVRSHGSLYERAVPIIAYGDETKGNYQRNLDIVAQIGQCLGGESL